VTQPKIGMLSSGYYLPPTQKTRDEVFRDEDLPSEPFSPEIDFHGDIGIDTIHVAGDVSATEIAVRSARRALDDAPIDGSDLDLIIDFTSIPEDHVAPTWSAAGSVQQELGARRATSFAINSGGCASYHVALKTACALLSSHDHLQTALLFSGDKTPACNHIYYPITITCDGGSAVILKKNHSRRVVLAVEVATVGHLHDVWYVPGLAQQPPGEPLNDKLLHMHSDLEKFKSDVIPINLFMFRRVMKLAMKKAGLKPKEIDYYIYPTFSTWDQKAFCEGLRIPPEKVYTASLARHGHLQENDMVINYVDAVAEGRIGEGDVVMVTTNGAGFTWSAALIQH
jgi:3-oxoacyl-[acyl-carrier-protein] synthase-3